MNQSYRSLSFLVALMFLAFLPTPSTAQVTITSSTVTNSFSTVSQVFQSNLKLTIKVDFVSNPGTVFCVVYKVKPAAIPTAEQIESYVNGSVALPSDIVARKSLAVSDNVQSSTLIPLSETLTYYTYVASKENSGLYTSVKSFTNRLLTAKKSPNSFYYAEYLPPGFNASSQCAMLIFLHGSGQVDTTIPTRVTNLEKVLTEGLPALLDQGKTLHALFNNTIVICPQAPVNSWDPRILDAFIEDLKVKYPNVDLTRIYLTGLSMGGIGTWNYALRHPDKLAAIVPISGKGDVGMACNIKKLPIWAFHDNPDGTVNVVNNGGTISMENAINACAGKITPRVTLYNYATNTHSAWNTAYSDFAKVKNGAMTSVTHRPVIDPTISPAPDPENIYDWLTLKKRLAVGSIVNIQQEDMVNVNPSTSVTLSTTSINSGATYHWEKVDSNPANTPALVLSGGETSTVSISNFTKAAKYTIRVTMIDNNGYIDTDEIVITTTNQLPIVDAGPDKITTLSSVTFSGSGLDPDGLPIVFRWYFLSGPSNFSLDSSWPTARNSKTLTINSLVPGNYQFRLTAVDNLDGVGSDTVKLTVSNYTPPTAGAGPDKLVTLPINSIILTGTGTVSTGTAIYSWSKVEGPTATLVNESTTALTVKDLMVGTYVFRFMVKDNTNAVAIDDVTVTVNAPPLVNAGIDQNITIPNVPTLVLPGTATDADGIMAYSWSKQSGPNVTMNDMNTPTLVLTNFSSAGIYTFRLTATDSKNATEYDEVTLFVSARIEAEAPQNTILGGGIVNVSKQSGGKSVMISSTGKITFPSIPAAVGTYKIRIWLRTGSYNEDSSYDNPTSYSLNYNVRLNSDVTPLPLSLDGNNIYVKETFYGRSYWGLMNATTVNLTESNTLDITSTANYAGIDYIEIVPVVIPVSNIAQAFSMGSFSLSQAADMIYPNPASENIKISVPAEATGLRISIADDQGNIVYYSAFTPANSGEAELDIRTLKPGIYVLRINSSKSENRTIRFVKE